MELSSLGINAAVITGIVALTEFVKKADKRRLLKRIYVFLPFILGVVAAFFVSSPFTWQTVGMNAIIYAGIASYAYNAAKSLFLPKNKKAGD